MPYSMGIWRSTIQKSVFYYNLLLLLLVYNIWLLFIFSNLKIMFGNIKINIHILVRICIWCLDIVLWCLRVCMLLNVYFVFLTANYIFMMHIAQCTCIYLYEYDYYHCYYHYCLSWALMAFWRLKFWPNFFFQLWIIISHNNIMCTQYFSIVIFGYYYFIDDTLYSHGRCCIYNCCVCNT